MKMMIKLQTNNEYKNKAVKRVAYILGASSLYVQFSWFFY